MLDSALRWQSVSDQRDTGRDVQLDDLALWNVVQVLDQGTQAVAVGREDKLLADFTIGAIVRATAAESAPRCPSALGQRQLVGAQDRDSADRGPGNAGRFFPGRRRDVVAAPPDLDLRLAVFGRGLRFVEALQGTIVPLIQPP